MTDDDVTVRARRLVSAIKRIEAEVPALREALRESAALTKELGEEPRDLLKLARVARHAKKIGMTFARLRWAVSDAERAYLEEPEPNPEEKRQ